MPLSQRKNDALKGRNAGGRFSRPQCCPKPPSPYGGSDSKRRRKCLSLFCCERRAGIGRTSTVAREEVVAPPASASPAPAAGLASLRQRPVRPEPAAAGGLGLWSWRSEAKAHGFCGGLHQPALGYRGFPQESDGRGGQAQDECDPRVAGRAGNCSPGRAPAARAALQILGRACSSALQIRERSKRVRYTSSLRSSMPKFLLYRYTLHQNRL